MNSKYSSVKRQKISSSIGSGGRGEHVCWTEAGEREEKLQIGDLLHQDVAYQSILGSALRDDQTTAHNEGCGDIQFEHEICLNLVNISTLQHDKSDKLGTKVRHQNMTKFCKPLLLKKSK